jgi:hypothetical protein
MENNMTTQCGDFNEINHNFIVKLIQKKKKNNQEFIHIC